MDHFISYAAAGNACLSDEERIEREAARIAAAAADIAAELMLQPDAWADALADFAYWPLRDAHKPHPQPELVAAIRAIRAGDYAEFGRICAEQIGKRIDELAHNKAEQEITP